MAMINAEPTGRLDLPDDEEPVLRALRRQLGPGLEIATPHRRVHRWLVAGREVLLDTFNGHRTCLHIARRLPGVPALPAP